MEGNESIGEPHRRTENRRIEYMRKGKAKESIESKSDCSRMSSCCSRITCFPARKAGKEGSIVKIATDRIGFAMKSEVAAH